MLLSRTGGAGRRGVSAIGDGSWAGGMMFGVLGGMKGEGDGKSGPLADAIALGLDGAAMKFDELLDDGKTEAEAAELAAGAAVGLAEAIEDIGEEIGVDAQAGVGNANDGVGIAGGEGDVDGAARGREFDGIG